MCMSVEARALSAVRVMRESPTSRLLAADLAPVILSILAEHFPQGAKARPAGELYELMVADFEVLRERFTLPKKPQDYCNDWVKAGWLVRKAGTSSRGETLEPSEDALAALEIVSRWEKPVSTVTASRIEAISASLSKLARETNEDIASRVASLRRERDLLDMEIERAERGEFEPLSLREARERIADIFALASAVPSDFARVRHDFETLNAQLRRQLLDPEGSRGDVLEQIFAGVDVIAESEAGRSFDGFRETLRDHEHAAWLDQWIQEILESTPGSQLSADERSRLRNLFRDMEASSDEVSRTMFTLTRSLSHYVTSEQFAEDRRMIELLREARGLAADAAVAEEFRMHHKLDTELQRIGMSISSVSRIRLHNPANEIVSDAPEVFAADQASTDALVHAMRESDIDFEELEGSITQTVTAQGPSTIGQILQHFPATQGLASIVGLIHLGTKATEPFSLEDALSVQPPPSTIKTEQVSWVEDNGTRRTATIPQVVFPAPTPAPASSASPTAADANKEK